MSGKKQHQIKRRSWREHEKGGCDYSCSCYGHHISASQVLWETDLKIICVPKKEHKKHAKGDK